eukprot:TRINITY_DN7106_c0_g1_i2.p1 TRINITY_DN7106_c0_g1~~TRINITY_DN7106_c0_g1_i2.p1  ORF type:complete len:571 (+),score=85.97 TRINITY_DN7106_c0_g1_i2:84-1796(+)
MNVIAVSYERYILFYGLNGEKLGEYFSVDVGQIVDFVWSRTAFFVAASSSEYEDKILVCKPPSITLSNQRLLKPKIGTQLRIFEPKGLALSDDESKLFAACNGVVELDPLPGILIFDTKTLQKLAFYKTSSADIPANFRPISVRWNPITSEVMAALVLPNKTEGILYAFREDFLVREDYSDIPDKIEVSETGTDYRCVTDFAINRESIFLASHLDQAVWRLDVETGDQVCRLEIKEDLLCLSCDEETVYLSVRDEEKCGKILFLSAQDLSLRGEISLGSVIPSYLRFVSTTSGLTSTTSKSAAAAKRRSSEGSTPAKPQPRLSAADTTTSRQGTTPAKSRKQPPSSNAISPQQEITPPKPKQSSASVSPSSTSTALSTSASKPQDRISVPKKRRLSTPPPFPPQPTEPVARVSASSADESFEIVPMDDEDDESGDSNSVLSEELEEYQQELEERLREEQEMENKLNQAQEGLEQAKSERESVQTRLQIVQESYNQALEELAILRNQRENCERDYQDFAEQHLAELSQLTARLKEVQDEQKHVSAQILKLQSEKPALQQELRRLEGIKFRG